MSSEPRNTCTFLNTAFLYVAAPLRDLMICAGRMWSVCFSPRLPGRAASRLCHSKAAKPSSSSSQSDPQRPKAEKQRRRREREEAVLTRQRNVSRER